MTTQERLIAQQNAGARAVGLLTALLSFGDVPALHRPSVEHIIAEFNGEVTEEEA